PVRLRLDGAGDGHQAAAAAVEGLEGAALRAAEVVALRVEEHDRLGLAQGASGEVALLRHGQREALLAGEATQRLQPGAFDLRGVAARAPGVTGVDEHAIPGARARGGTSGAG